MDRKRPHRDDDRHGHSKSHRSDRNGDRSRRRGSPEARPRSRSPERIPRSRPDPPGGIQARLQQVAAESSANYRIEDDKSTRPIGNGGGRRGARRPRPTDAQMADFVVTREITQQKTAPRTAENEIQLVANFFELTTRHAWTIYRYHIDFQPEVEQTYAKRSLFRPHFIKFGPSSVFDGSAIYVTSLIDPANLNLQSQAAGSEEIINIIINPNYVEVGPRDPMNIQIYNILLRECMRKLDLRQMGRYYYDSDPKAAFFHQRERLEVWPGYKTSFRQHERSLMLCVDMTSKVLHQDTILDFIKHELHRKTDKDAIADQLKGLIVMTNYNARPYKIDDMRWDQTAETTFDYQGTPTSYAEYLKIKYRITIKHLDQPILFSIPKKSQQRRGMKEPIALLPELCRMTGLTKEQRANFGLMKDLSVRLQMNPADRVHKILEFSRRMEDRGVCQKVLTPAGLRLSNKLVEVAGRRLPVEKIYVDKPEAITPNIDNLDWTVDLLKSKMRTTVDLKYWATVTDDEAGVDSFVKLVRDKASAMGFRIASPTITKRVPKGRGRDHQNYAETIQSIMAGDSKIQLIMIFLSRTDEDLYGVIKRKCYLEFGVASQCVTMRKLRDKHKEGGIASKVAIQMNAKLGGIPWEVGMPIKSGMMIIGYNISHMGNTRDPRGQSVGALVATMNPGLSKFFSMIVELEKGQNVSTVFAIKMTELLRQYKKKNNDQLPNRIFFYRDGVGEGQLQTVVDTEVEEIKRAIDSTYTETALPNLWFIVVNKRINTKFFVPPQGHRKHENPKPGTVVDDVVTFPERYDFYLISQKGTGQGTISPTCYNVISQIENDSTKSLPPDRLQWLTNKFCYLYYNWCSTVAVPHVCQYASKLAFLHNLMNKGRGHEESEIKPQLASTLYYL